MSPAALKAEHTAALQVLFAGILWGLIGPLVKLMEYAGSTAELTAFLRMAFAFLIMGAISLIKFGPRSFKVDLKTLISCAALGIITNGVYNVAYNIAIEQTGMAISAVLMNTAPVFTTIFSVLLFHEGVTLLKVCALLINIVGCSLAATGGNFDVATLSVLGIACGVLSGLTYGLAAIIARIAGGGANSYVMSTYSFLFAALSVGVVCQPWEALGNANAEVMGYGFLLALVPTSLGYLIYYKAVMKIEETSRVPVYTSIEIVATAIMGVAFFNEVLNGVALMGVAMVLVSIALMNLHPKKKSCPTPKSERD